MREGEEKKQRGGGRKAWRDRQVIETTRQVKQRMTRNTNTMTCPITIHGIAHNLMTIRGNQLLKRKQQDQLQSSSCPGASG